MNNWSLAAVSRWHFFSLFAPLTITSPIVMSSSCGGWKFRCHRRNLLFVGRCRFKMRKVGVKTLAKPGSRKGFQEESFIAMFYGNCAAERVSRSLFMRWNSLFNKTFLWHRRSYLCNLSSITLNANSKASLCAHFHWDEHVAFSS